MELQLLNFIKQNKENWKEILQQPPYSLIAKEDDDYILLKYNQLESDIPFDLNNQDFINKHKVTTDYLFNKHYTY